MITVRFSFDIGDTVEFGPLLRGRVILARWDGFKRDYHVHYWDEDKTPCELWIDEAELSKPE